MQEPRPVITLPPSTQSLLRVGLVLEEDAATRLHIGISCSGAELQSAHKKQRLSSNETYRVEACAGEILVRDSSDSVCGSYASPLIIHADKQECSPQTGLKLWPLIAGRQFHWRKEIAAHFPGNLEIHLCGSHLVVVNVVPFEHYIACVISSEMSPACPPAFMRSQAIAARSWAVCFLGSKHPGKLYTICNDDDCQRYQGTTHACAESIAQAQACRGEFLVDSAGNTCAAYYSKSCGGHTEKPELAFGFSAPGVSAISDSEKVFDSSINLSDPKQFHDWLSERPQTQTNQAGHGIFCSPHTVLESDLKKYLGAVDESQKYYRWSVRYSHDELAALLSDKTGVPIRKIVDFIPGPRGVSGRLLSLQVKYQDKRNRRGILGLQDQYDVRRALSPSFLLSSAFAVSPERDSSDDIKTVLLNGAGWGHGVGLCQIGAVGMALLGKSYQEILRHYFPDTTVRKCY